MAADQVSQRNSPNLCANCGSAVEGALAPHVCSHCGQPQPVAAGEDYFSAFGVARKFSQDPRGLEKRFYELSRALHPDRFTTSGPELRQRSLDRMSFLNQAYQTLKNTDELTAYVLELAGYQSRSKPDVKAKPSMPMELAESWFEIQDLLTEDPERAQVKLAGFEAELSAFQNKEDAELAALRSAYDNALASSPSSSLLEAIARKMQTKSYLKSLERDVLRIKARFQANRAS